jgi:hypothetical protein
METENIEILSDAIKEYFGNYEFDELCSRFGLEIEYQGIHPNRKKLVTGLITGKYRDNNRKFLDVILPKLLRSCEERILNTTWKANIFVGKVTLSIIECVDTQPVVIKEIGRKWREAKVYLN